MANAAAKKAAAARKEAASIYNPILGGTNLVYILLLIRKFFFQQEQSLTFWSLVPILTLAGLQYYAYIGIMDDAENNTRSSNKDKNNLVGGSSLDLLAITWVVQFGTVLWSHHFYWLLAILPPWAAWTLYQTFYGSKKKQQATSEAPAEEDEALKERRQKRAERRRQKRY